MASTWSDDSWNSHHLLAGCTANTVKLWDPHTSTHANLVMSPDTASEVSQHLGPRRSLCWNVNGKVLSYAGKFPFLVMHAGQSTTLGFLPANAQKKRAWPSSVGISKTRFACSSLYLLACSDEGVMYVFNCKRQDLSWSARLHTSTITALALSADKDTIASASAGKVLLYSLQKAQQASQNLVPQPAPIELPSSNCQQPTALIFSETEEASWSAKGNNLLACSSMDGNVVVWRMSDLSVTSTLTGKHPGGATGVGFGTSGALFTCGMDGTICSTDLRTPRQDGMKGLAGCPVTCLDIRHTGYHIGVGTATGSMMTFDARRLQLPTSTLSLGSDPVTEVAWQPIKPVSRSSRSSSAQSDQNTSAVKPAPAAAATPPSVQQGTLEHGISPLQETPPTANGSHPSSRTAISPSFIPEVSPAPSGLTVTPDLGKVPSRSTGLLGASISIPSFADLPPETEQSPHSGDTQGPTDPDPSSTANPPLRSRASSLSGSSSSQSRPSTAGAAPTTRPSTQARPSGAESSRRVTASGAIPQPAPASTAAAKSARGTGVASNRYVTATQTKTQQTSQPRPEPSSTAAATPTPTPSQPAPHTLPNGAAEEGPRTSTSGVEGGRGNVHRPGGGRFLTEETFQAYSDRMEARLQDGQQSLHLDMIRSFHMQQVQLEQVVEGVMARQDELDAKLDRILAIMERSMQLNTSSAASWL